MADLRSVKVLTWEGILSVDQAASKKAELLSALDKASQVVVSVSLVDALDISLLQVLAAAALEARQRQKEFHLTGTLKSELRRILHVSGMVRDPSDNAREIEPELFGMVKGQAS